MNENLSNAFDSGFDRSSNIARGRNASTSSESLFTAISDVQMVLKELCLLVKVLMERVMMIPSTLSDANVLERPYSLPLERNQQERNAVPLQSNIEGTLSNLSMKLDRIEKKVERVEAFVSKGSGTLRELSSSDDDIEKEGTKGRKVSPGNKGIPVTRKRRSSGRGKQKPPENTLEDKSQSDVKIKEKTPEPHESQTKKPRKKAVAPSRVPSTKLTKKTASGTSSIRCSSPLESVCAMKSIKEEHTNQSSTTIWYWYPCENSDHEQSEAKQPDKIKEEEPKKVDVAWICKTENKDTDQDKKQKIIKSQVKGTRIMGEYERRLVERRNRREERRILSRGRRLARAMSKFSHLVVGAAREMGYLPADISRCDRSSYSHSDLGYSDSSSESSYYSCSCSDSCCSCTCTEYSDSLDDNTSSMSTSISSGSESKMN